MLENREALMPHPVEPDPTGPRNGVVVVDLFYLPPIEFFVAIEGMEELWIEKHDNYQKQSYRNRTRVQLANQVKDLSIPVIGGNKKTRYVDVKMDDGQNWRKIHLRGLQSAYGKAPFFEYFYSDFEKIFLGKHTNLYAFNIELLTICLKALRHPARLVETSIYQSYRDEIDLRGVIRTKESFEYRNIYKPFPYTQVFGLNFAPALGIVDLLFCEGPNSSKVISRSKKRIEQ